MDFFQSILGPLAAGASDVAGSIGGSAGAGEPPATAAGLGAVGQFAGMDMVQLMQALQAPDGPMAQLPHMLQNFAQLGNSLPMSVPQFENVLSAESMNRLVGQLGTTPADAGTQMAQLLPGLMGQLMPAQPPAPDQATPFANLPDAQARAGQGAGGGLLNSQMMDMLGALVPRR